MHIKLSKAIHSDYWGDVNGSVSPTTLFPEIEDGDFVVGNYDPATGQINNAETLSRNLPVGSVDYGINDTVTVKTLPVYVDENGEAWIDRETYFAI